jgi:hypothetical protein
VSPSISKVGLESVTCIKCLLSFQQ